MLLASMGANVIKIESTTVGDPARLSPPFADGESLPFATLNRGKQSLAVNYRRPDGRSLVHQLLSTADVFVETLKPGQAARYKLDYDTVRRINPTIVYCSLSGYGQSSAYASRSGHDLNFLALTGLLDLLRGSDGKPTMPGFQLSDVAGGALFATIAILAALVERTLTGQGQYVDVSIWEGTASLAAIQIAPVLADLKEASIAQESLAGELPCYNVYETSDGQYMALGALEPVLWGEFCQAVERPDLIPHQYPGAENRPWVLAEMMALFQSRSRAQWEAFLADKDLCCEPVLGLDELTPQQLEALGGQVLAGGQLAPPQALSCGAPPLAHAPSLGEHTTSVLAALGLSSEEISQLRADRIVSTPEDTTRRRLRTLEAIQRSRS
jgi:crotonobetainyl-CoA:carnitine CoA-transferase CaiB-like acyl-CoA transferase